MADEPNSHNKVGQIGRGEGGVAGGVGGGGGGGGVGPNNNGGDHSPDENRRQLNLTPMQIFKLKKNWKGIRRRLEDTGVEMLIR